MSEDDLRATGGLVVYIGQVLTNGQSNNIWQERDFNRMPVISNTMTVKAPVSYVGSFLGGPVYVRPVNAGAQFTVTLSARWHTRISFTGTRAREEFERNRTSSAPYFDLEVWDDSVRHSGPKARAERFDYDQLADAAVLWDKIACVSNRVPAGSSGDTGITFLYDPFIAAGSMVAFVGRYTCNCPPNCLTAALDAESAVENPSDAFWGCIHEFNHHYQRFGFHPGDEVTNNAVSLVEYSLFTRVSARRALGSADQGSYAVGWNRYTNPAWTLLETLNNGSVNSGLDSYANLLHAFGQDTFIAAAAAGNRRGRRGRLVPGGQRRDGVRHDVLFHRGTASDRFGRRAGRIRGKKPSRVRAGGGHLPDRPDIRARRTHRIQPHGTAVRHRDGGGVHTGFQRKSGAAGRFPVDDRAGERACIRDAYQDVGRRLYLHARSGAPPLGGDVRHRGARPRGRRLPAGGHHVRHRAAAAAIRRSRENGVHLCGGDHVRRPGRCVRERLRGV